MLLLRHHISKINKFGLKQRISSPKLKMNQSEYYQDTKDEFSNEKILNNKFREFILTKPNIVLGSFSKSRKSIMNELSNEFNFNYKIQKAGIDEKSIRKKDPNDLVMTLGYAKSDAIIKQGFNDGYLITCDQVVIHDGKIIEKPESADEFRNLIKSYANNPAGTIGSVVCVHCPSGMNSSYVDQTKIVLSDIPDSVIEELIKEGEIFNCAGGLMIEHILVEPFVLSIEGGDDAVRGISKNTVKRVLVETWMKVCT